MRISNTKSEAMVLSWKRVYCPLGHGRVASPSKGVQVSRGLHKIELDIDRRIGAALAGLFLSPLIYDIKKTSKSFNTCQTFSVMERLSQVRESILCTCTFRHTNLNSHNFNHNKNPDFMLHLLGYMFKIYR